MRNLEVEAQSLHQRIDYRIKKQDNGCWHYDGYHNHKGYPVINWGKVLRINRIQFERFNRKLLSNECVLHNCDNKKCINLEHLKVGSDLENKKEMFDRNLLDRDKVSGKFKSPVK